MEKAFGRFRVGFCRYPKTVGGHMISYDYRDAQERIRTALLEDPQVSLQEYEPGEPAPQPRHVIHVAPAWAIAHGWFQEKQHWLYQLEDVENLKARAVARNVHFIVVSPFLKMVLAARFGIPSAAIPPGMDDHFKAASVDRHVIAGTEALTLRYAWFAGPIKAEYELLKGAWMDAFSAFGGLVNADGTKAVGVLIDRHKVSLTVKMVESDGPENGKAVAQQTLLCGKTLTVDTRHLAFPQGLRDFFEGHDVFIVLPGCASIRPAVEAAASGCLIITPPVRSLADFFGEENAVVYQTDKGLGEAIARVAKEWGTSRLEAIRENGVRKARAMSWAKAAEGLVANIRAFHALTVAKENGDLHDKTLDPNGKVVEMEAVPKEAVQ